MLTQVVVIIVLIAGQFPGKAKVGDLDTLSFLLQQAVATRQVDVHDTLAGDKGHAVCDLDRHVENVLGIRTDFRALVITLGSIEPRRFSESVLRVRRQEILSNKK